MPILQDVFIDFFVQQVFCMFDETLVFLFLSVVLNAYNIFSGLSSVFSGELVDFFFKDYAVCIEPAIFGLNFSACFSWWYAFLEDPLHQCLCLQGV